MRAWWQGTHFVAGDDFKRCESVLVGTYTGSSTGLGSVVFQDNADIGWHRPCVVLPERGGTNFLLYAKGNKYGLAGAAAATTGSGITIDGTQNGGDSGLSIATTGDQTRTINANTSGATLTAGKVHQRVQQ